MAREIIVALATVGALGVSGTATAPGQDRPTHRSAPAALRYFESAANLDLRPRELASYVAAAGSSPQSTEIYGEWSSPINVGPPVNTEYNDMYAILSRDELTMYFTSDRLGGVGGDDLWFTTRESGDDAWGEPQNMRALNTSAADSLAVLSSDEHVMFFHSIRPGGCGAGDIWVTRRHNRRSEEWDPPINLGCVVNTAATEIAPAFFENPETGQVTLFYGSNRWP